MRHAAPLALLAIWIATAAVYAQVVQFGFVTWDDPLYVTANAQVQRGLSLANAEWALSARVDSNWLPITWLSHMLDVELFGTWAGGQHATNLLLHGIDTALLFALLLSATRAPLASAFAAALFALHPLHTEVVAWVSQRKELLSTGFGLLAALAYVSWTRRGGALRYAGLAFAFAAALASKAMLVTLPFALLLFDYWPLGRTRFGPRAGDAIPRSAARLLLEKLPLLALSAACCAVAFDSQQLARANAPDLPLAVRLAHAAVVPFRYLALAVWPSPLSVLYPHPYAPELGGEPWSRVTVAAAAAALVAVTAGVIAVRRRPYLAFGWLWFLGTLVPVIGLVQVGPQGYADRYTYVPLIGPFIALAWGARDAIAASGERTVVRAAAWALASTVLLAAAWASHARARVWRDSESLYVASLAATPRNPLLLFNLGVVQAQQGRSEDAARSYEAALAIDPEHPSANTNLGNIRLRTGHPEQAIERYRAALRGDPDDVQALQNLGRVLAWRGELAEAVAELERAVRLAPGNLGVRRDLEATRAALLASESGSASPVETH
ncbi:MAG TPA: tetratricopeptide repeat protein [Myxococcota bacterium]|nr:tetratricopeptide repeat protein [Myxococcota bacterium]